MLANLVHSYGHTGRSWTPRSAAQFTIMVRSYEQTGLVAAWRPLLAHASWAGRGLAAAARPCVLGDAGFEPATSTV